VELLSVQSLFVNRILVHLHDFCIIGDPTNDPSVYGDPFKTLFVARIVCIFPVILI